MENEVERLIIKSAVKCCACYYFFFFAFLICVSWEEKWGDKTVSRRIIPKNCVLHFTSILLHGIPRYGVVDYLLVPVCFTAIE